MWSGLKCIKNFWDVQERFAQLLEIEKKKKQLKSVAKCIGFKVSKGSYIEL